MGIWRKQGGSRRWEPRRAKFSLQSRCSDGDAAGGRQTPGSASRRDGTADPYARDRQHVLVQYAAGGVKTIETLGRGSRWNLVFVRQRTGPAYGYEIAHARFLRKTVGEFGEPGVGVEVVVVDSYQAVLLRWRALGALKNAVGKLTTFEYDTGRAATARQNFREAGVDHFVQWIEGDTHQTVQQLKEPIDIVFIDAGKEGYVDYRRKLLPRVRPGGLILAHNVNRIPDYHQEINSNPDLETILDRKGEGLAITLKKRCIRAQRTGGCLCLGRLPFPGPGRWCGQGLPVSGIPYAAIPELLLHPQDADKLGEADSKQPADIKMDVLPIFRA